MTRRSYWATFAGARFLYRLAKPEVVGCQQLVLDGLARARIGWLLPVASGLAVHTNPQEIADVASSPYELAKYVQTQGGRL